MVRPVDMVCNVAMVYTLDMFYPVDMVCNVDMVYPVDTVYTVYTVSTIETAFHCFNISIPFFIPLFSFEIEYYIYETDFTIGLSQKISFLSKKIDKKC